MRGHTVLLLSLWAAVASAWSPAVHHRRLATARAAAHPTSVVGTSPRRWAVVTRAEEETAEVQYDEKWAGLPETKEEAWENPYLKDKARASLIQKYLDLGKTQEYAEEEVAAFLDDPERSTDYMMQFAFAEAPGSLKQDPNQMFQYAGIFVFGFFGSAAVKALAPYAPWNN
mmetsp:Transcript_13258/g.31024  ORF Transcript_13258/g.31024 Transcript_13258/m.31024 type:complete len:171 (-) Transcript_13258:184-696(-)